MSATYPNDFSREGRLDEVLAAYLEAVEAGRLPDQREWLARYPDLAGELADFFANRHEMAELAAPLRAVAHAVRADESATIAEGEPEPERPPVTRVRYFGDYELLGEIARGGMGVVYKARQVTLDRIVALKMIRSGELASAADVERFRTEARAAARLQHPNIVAIHEVGEQDGQQYFSMDYVAGRSLAEIVREDPLPAARAAGYVRVIAEAIHYAHRQGIVHRDLKPSNVLVDATDRPLVTDFGLAKTIAGDSELTATGQLLGTPHYMSPEQAAARHAAVGPASDVYSLGAILYDLLTGRPPFKAETVLDTLQQVREADPVPPRLLNAKVPRDLDTICIKCLEKEPSRRYASAQDLADDLGRFLAGEPIRAQPPTIPFAARVWFQQNVRVTAWTVLVGLLCGFVNALPFLFVVVPRAVEKWSSVYQDFPSLQAPGLAALPVLESEWARVLVSVLITPALLFSGVLAVLVVRPANRAGDIAVGSASSLVAGVTFFAIGLAPFFVWFATITPTHADWSALEQALDEFTAPPAPGVASEDKRTLPSQTLAQAYPDLRDVPASRSWRLVLHKIHADLAARGAHGIWLGLLIAILFPLLNLPLVLVAGHRLRRQAEAGEPRHLPFSWSVVFVGYLAASVWVIAYLVFALIAGFPGELTAYVLLVTLWFVLWSTATQVMERNVRERGWRRSRLLNWACMAAVALCLCRTLPTIPFAGPMPWYVDVSWLPWYVDLVVYAFSIVVAVLYFQGEGRRDHGSTAAVTSSKSV